MLPHRNPPKVCIRRLSVQIRVIRGDKIISAYRSYLHVFFPCHSSFRILLVWPTHGMSIKSGPSCSSDATMPVT